MKTFKTDILGVAYMVSNAILSRMSKGENRVEATKEVKKSWELAFKCGSAMVESFDMEVK